MMKTTITLLCLGILISCQPKQQNTKLKLWYEQPAVKWEEALPVGNGRIGGMIYGDPQREKIQFNEETLWTGEPHEYQHIGAHKYLDTIRELLFAGKQGEADQIAGKELMSEPLRQKAYQPFGDLIIEMTDLGDVNDYYRALDLNEAIAKVDFTADGFQYHREVWVSYPDQVMAINLTVDGKKKLNFDLAFASPHAGYDVEGSGEGLKLKVKVENGILEGEALAWIHDTDGQIEIKQNHIQVRNASSALILMSVATSFQDYQHVDADPSLACRDIYNKLRNKKLRSIKNDHLRDYKEIFDRFSIDFGSGKDSLPTNERILEFWKNPNDPSFLSLYSQYGRYLMISSSRGEGQPATLQGIWNPHIKPPWDSKWTVNINTEMNYWPVEATGLVECLNPLFKMIEECAETGKAVAMEHYDAPGWVLHHNTDIWRGTAPINAANHGIWVTGGAWLSTHMWEHFLFTQDKEFLKERAWPVIKGAAEFFVDYLVEDPETGWLISGPGNSPENGGLVMGPTMDHQIIRTLFKACIEASEILDIEKEFHDILTDILPRIAPNQIGQYGQLQEWLTDIDNPNNHHRHVSHLWGVYPGNDITWDQEDLMEAAKQSLLMRGDEGTGWSLAWKINFWARFLDGNHAYKLIHMLLSPAGHPDRNVRGGTYPNLFDAHPPFQIDGNFGGTAGIIEMLIQSHNGEIHLLPALPDALPKGSIAGVRARGGFILDFSWENGQINELKVVSTAGGTCILRQGEKSVEFETEAGKQFFFNEDLIMQ